MKEDDIPKFLACIVIDSGDEDPLRVESESESYRLQINNIEEEDDNNNDSGDAYEVSEQEVNLN